MISFDTYRALYAEARQYEDIDRYIMERGWQDWMDSIGDADQIADLLRAIHAVSREGIIGMLAVDGTKLTEFCKRYCLPYSTAQKWKLGTVPPSDQMMILLGYAVISNKA